MPRRSFGDKGSLPDGLTGQLSGNVGRHPKRKVEAWRDKGMFFGETANDAFHSYNDPGRSDVNPVLG